MVGGKRVQFGVEVDAGGVNPNPRRTRIENLHLRMDLHNRYSQRGTSVDNGVFAKENDLAGRGGVHDR